MVWLNGEIFHGIVITVTFFDEEPVRLSTACTIPEPAALSHITRMDIPIEEIVPDLEELPVGTIPPPVMG